MIINLDEHNCLSFETDNNHIHIFLKADDLEKLYDLLRNYYGDVW